MCLGMLGFCLLLSACGDDRPTIDSLIGNKIWIEDSFAGPSFTLSN